jgi:allantoinase
MSQLDCIIRAARVVTPEGIQALDLGMANGLIVELSPGIFGSAREELSFEGSLLVPGMIDAHVHFNEPGRTDWEGFATGSTAAAAGGVTTVFDMPLNSSPVTVTPEAFRTKAACAAAHSRVKTRLWGGLVPGFLDQLEPLHACGVVGFKAFMSNSGIDEFPRSDTETLRRGMKIIARLPGMSLAVHAEDEALTAQLAAEAIRTGRIDPASFAASRPVEAELQAIREVLDLAGETGCPLHIVHVSCPEGVALVADARRKGVNVTVETCPHYLNLTVEDLDRLGALAKCAPPLRSSNERNGLWQSIARGDIDTIGSDHSPCPPELKARRPFMQAWGGISGIQHALPLTYSEGLHRGIPAERLAALLSANPGRRFHLGPHSGVIKIGAPADLCLLVPSAGQPILKSSLKDRHQHSPYLGQTPTWRVERTWVDGKTVFAQ